MFLYKCFILSMFRETVLLTLLLVHSGSFEEATKNIELLTKQYRLNLNSSRTLEKDDRRLRNSWTLDLQMQRINVTTMFRLQVTRDGERSFHRTEASKEWLECLYLHRRQLRKSKQDYYKNESECLTDILAGDKDRERVVEQLEKEIRKWRRSYRYLVNTCNVNHPGDKQDADACLVESMERDNFSRVIQRLLTLKMDAMGQLLVQMTASLTALEDCLKTQLSAYLETLRNITDTLNKCHALRTLGPNA